MQTANWRSGVDLIAKWEGGKATDPRDTWAYKNRPPGTEVHTNRGVTWPYFKAYFPKATGKPATVDNFLNLTPEDAKLSFKAGAWDAVWGDRWPATHQGVIDYLAYFVWGSGTFWPVTILQRILNIYYQAGLAVDGGFGNKTFQAAISVNPITLLDHLHRERATYLRNLSNTATYGKGWDNAINDAYEAAKKKCFPS